MYIVYWIKYKTHVDPYNEGYIGITSNIKRRFNYHSNVKASDNPILLNAIKKGAQIYELHVVDTKDQALKLEEEYRPNEKIGWNIIKGGSSPPSQLGKKYGSNHGFKGGRHSEEHKLKVSQLFKNLRWFNNGSVNKRSTSCPEGFIEGRLKFKSYNLSETGKNNLGKSGTPIFTPFGKYDTIRQAANAIGIKESRIGYMVKSPKYDNWYKIND